MTPSAHLAALARAAQQLSDQLCQCRLTRLQLAHPLPKIDLERMQNAIQRLQLHHDAVRAILDDMSEAAGDTLDEDG